MYEVWCSGIVKTLVDNVSLFRSRAFLLGHSKKRAFIHFVMSMISLQPPVDFDDLRAAALPTGLFSKQ